jgi:glycosyltransferase involved in cell wall biosynthesis
MKSSVFVFDPTVSDKQSKVRGVGRYLQVLKENFPDWNFISELPFIQESNHPTIFINPFFNFLSPPLLMKRIAQKQIAVIHDLIPLIYPKHFPIGIKGKLIVFLNKLSLKNYDRIITDSEASKKDIIKILNIPENRIIVIYPCLPKIFTNLKFQKTTNYKLSTTNYCLYVGDATWNKNLVNLAKAIKILNVTGIFVGKVFDPSFMFHALRFTLSHPWQKELNAFFNEIKNDKRFILKGFVSDEELIRFFQQARVNVLPSRDEGFGFSFLEAASQKCPSVLSDIPVLHEISNEKALFTHPYDPHEIANAIGELYWNPEKRNLIGLQAYEQSNKFSPSNFKKSFRKLIENL